MGFFSDFGTEHYYFLLKYKLIIYKRKKSHIILCRLEIDLDAFSIEYDQTVEPQKLSSFRFGLSYKKSYFFWTWTCVMNKTTTPVFLLPLSEYALLNLLIFNFKILQ